MSTFYDDVMEYFKHCEVALHKRFVPPYIASACCHVLNLENQKREFYMEHGRLANMRLHIFMVAPPGYSKSLLLLKFLEGSSCALGPTNIERHWEGAMTEAAFSGTVKISEGEVVEVYGAAHEHKRAIVGIEEFSALTNMMKMEHSINLDNAMLTALDNGYVLKRLALGKIHYQTQLTLWTGSQPARFDLTSGLGRRMYFIFFIPTKVEEAEIRKARRRAKNVRPRAVDLALIQQKFRGVNDTIKKIKRIEFADNLYSELDKLKIPHFEETLYERFALGYVLAQGQGDRHTYVEMIDNNLREQFRIERDWRSEIKKGSELSQVLSVIRDFNVAPISEIKRKLADFGIPYTHATKILDMLEKFGEIQTVLHKPKDGQKGRPARYVMLKTENQ